MSLKIAYEIHGRVERELLVFRADEQKAFEDCIQVDNYGGRVDIVLTPDAVELLRGGGHLVFDSGEGYAYVIRMESTK